MDPFCFIFSAVIKIKIFATIFVYSILKTMQCLRNRQKEVKLAPKIYFSLCFFIFCCCFSNKYFLIENLAVSWALQVCIYVKKLNSIYFSFSKNIHSSPFYIFCQLFFCNLQFISFLLLFDNHTFLSVLSEFIFKKRWHLYNIYYYHLLLRINCQNEMIKLRLHISVKPPFFFKN